MRIPFAWPHENTNIHSILKKCRRSGREGLPAQAPSLAAGLGTGISSWLLVLTQLIDCPSSGFAMSEALVSPQFLATKDCPSSRLGQICPWIDLVPQDAHLEREGGHLKPNR